MNLIFKIENNSVCSFVELEEDFWKSDFFT